MNAILVKLFATALTLSQVTTRPEAVKTAFDPVQDQGQVAQILKDGCAHMRKAFDIEDLNLDSLIDTAMSDPQTVAGEIKAFRGINFDDLAAAYKQFCGSDAFDEARFDLKPVIESFPKLEELVWVQEEPENMGAWGFVRPLTEELAEGRWPLRYVGRARSASPSEGTSSWHAANQKILVEEAYLAAPDRRQNQMVLSKVI